MNANRPGGEAWAMRFQPAGRSDAGAFRAVRDLSPLWSRIRFDDSAENMSFGGIQLMTVSGDLLSRSGEEAE
jgi:hypothetical protein